MNAAIKTLLLIVVNGRADGVFSFTGCAEYSFLTRKKMSRNDFK